MTINKEVMASSSDTKIGSLEDAAFKRKERLKELKRKAEESAQNPSSEQM